MEFFMNRILLFAAMQIGILIVVSIVGSVLLAIFNIQISSASYIGLLAFCAIYGFVGSFISLFMSKRMCKMAYGVQTISSPRTSRELFLVNTIAELSQKANLAMPEVGIYQSSDPNAFATGASRDNALVAVSSGLLDSMTEDEVRGVLGHEISHIQNGDMVTMSLLQGVLNTFVYFFSYIISKIAIQALNRNSDDEESGASFSDFMLFHLINSILQVVFGIISTMILMWFSRQREFRADAGSANIAGRKCMIRALEALQRNVQPAPNQKASMQALCINGASLGELFSSHPPLTQRIAALKQL
jgi:heat shock protein HtpX